MRLAEASILSTLDVMRRARTTIDIGNLLRPPKKTAARSTWFSFIAGTISGRNGSWTNRGCC